jgi:hypothetical protein
MLNYSSEIRWFLSGPMPTAMAEWFNLPILGGEPEIQTDDYLLLPNCHVTGVKMREDKLQVKSLCREPTPLMITDQISGWAASWVKWSIDLDSATARAFYQENLPVRVQKRRWRRKLSVETDQSVEVPLEMPIEYGCFLELSTLQVRDATWWSLNLESFGPAQTIDESLRRCIYHFLRKPPPPTRLLAADSKSYPEWLTSLSPPTTIAKSVTAGSPPASSMAGSSMTGTRGAMSTASSAMQLPGHHGRMP